MRLPPLKKCVGAIEIDAVETLRHDAIDIASRTSVDQILPRGIPELNKIIPRPSSVLLREPCRSLQWVIPVGLPIRPIAFGFSDREVGKQHSRAAIRTALQTDDFGSRQFTFKGSVRRDLAVDHKKIMRR